MTDQLSDTPARRRPGRLLDVFLGAFVAVLAGLVFLGYQGGHERDVAVSQAGAVAKPVEQVCSQGGPAADALTAADPHLCQHASDAANAPAVAGAAGRDGRDGVGIRRVDTQQCALTVTLTTGAVSTLNGLCGHDGAAGRSVSAAATAGECSVLITFSDGATTTVGPFCGKDGTDGKDGADGKDGRDGADCDPTVKPECRGPAGPPGPTPVSAEFRRASDGGCNYATTWRNADGTQFALSAPAPSALCDPPPPPPSTTTAALPLVGRR